MDVILQALYLLWFLLLALAGKAVMFLVNSKSNTVKNVNWNVEIGDAVSLF
jgi:hypothetical protein